MAFILVEWVDDDSKQYSVTKKTNIVDEELRGKGDDLLGLVVPVQWGRKSYRGKILKIGKQPDLNNLADELAKQEAGIDGGEPGSSTLSLANGGRSTSRRAKKRKSDKIANQIDDVLASIDLNEGVNLDQVDETAGDEPDTAVEREKDYKAKYKVLRNKYRQLKEDYKRIREEGNSDAMVELSPLSGVFARRADLEAAKLMSNKMTVLARNLFRVMFSKEDLSTHSLQGKVSNACKGRSALPSIDASRRDAIIAYVLQESNFGLSDVGRKEHNRAKTEVMKSLSDFLRENHRKSIKA